MLTGIAFMPHPGHSFGLSGLVFIVVVVVLIAGIFLRMYAGGDRSRRRTAHRTGRRSHRR